MQEQKEVSTDLKAREQAFNEGLKRLLQETELAISVFPVLTQDGRIGAGMQLVDNSPEAKAVRESQQEQASGVSAA